MRYIYYGNYQNDVKGVMKSCLRKGDLFIDVGANIGFMSAYAMSLVGKSGRIYAFEPVPDMFTRLEDLRFRNPDYYLVTNRLALGDNNEHGLIAISTYRNIGANTMVPSLLGIDNIKTAIEIDVVRLDDYLLERGLTNVRLIKIDVEGYEWRVIKGMDRYLRSASVLPWIIVEIQPKACQSLLTSMTEMGRYMEEFGFKALHLDGRESIDIKHLSKVTDVLFMPRR